MMARANNIITFLKVLSIAFIVVVGVVGVVMSMCTFKCVCMHVHWYACMCTSLMNQMYFLLCRERQMKARGKSLTPFPLSIFFAHRNNTCGS